MLNLKKILFGGGAASELPQEVRSALEQWQAMPAPRLDDLHYHVRYVVVDLAVGGPGGDGDQLKALAASSVQHSMIVPGDTFYADLEAQEDAAAVDRRLMAFLQYAAKAPLVTYHVPYVGAYLKQIYRERFGIEFEAQWVDLAWLLPAMFEEKCHTVMPLDHWIELFGLNAGQGRRDAMDNNLLLARIFQMLLVRVVGKQIDTAERLVDESRASRFLRRTH